jgi:hypothetical protein
MGYGDEGGGVETAREDGEDGGRPREIVSITKTGSR